MSDPLTYAAITGGISLIGGIFGRKSAKSAQNKEEAFLQQKYDEYDLPLWNMGKDRLIAQRDEMIRGIQLTQKNEKALAEFKDKNNLRNWRQQLKIQEVQHQGQLQLFRRSNLFADQAIGSAQEQAAMERFETRQQFAFQNEANIIESIQKKGELRATSQSGRSAVKAAQSQLADEGRQVAILTENIVSADRSSRMRLRDFILKTDAQRMLRPSDPIKPLKPLETPLAKYELPRELEDFDFGPQPIKGVSTVQVPSWGSVLAGAATSAASTYATAKFGNSSFSAPSGGGNIVGNTSTNPNLTWSSMSNAGFPTY
tara:strand:+ start:984 stop:1925 length:942 start_codon:yes stop_codon:yes gene_type:complete